jgi:hypothetical protein
MFYLVSFSLTTKKGLGHDVPMQLAHFRDAEYGILLPTNYTTFLTILLPISSTTW